MNLDPKMLLVALSSVTFFACSGGDTLTPQDGGADGGIGNDGGTNTDGGTDTDGGIGTDSGVPAITASMKANLRFKRNLRLTNDLAQGLELASGAVCQEFGLYDCATFVHTVTLGGTGGSAYLQGLYRPTTQTSVSTPLAVDRLVLHACEARAQMDLDAPANAVVFKNLVVDASGNISNADSGALEAVVNDLYRRSVQRDATDEEKEHLHQLYRDFETQAAGSTAKDWAVLSCYVVFSTMEALFY